MSPSDFERILGEVCAELTRTARVTKFTSSKDFENAVRNAMRDKGRACGVDVIDDPHPHAFPDITFGRFGVEVKYSDKDTWRSIANSIFEGRRDHDVEEIYLVFGKMGGDAEVRFAPYAQSVIHVRTSHVPRFEIELSDKPSLFETHFGVSYAEFRQRDETGKMELVRAYAKKRLGPGQQLWWLGDATEDTTVPEKARLYTSLTDADEKRRLQAESALLCPEIVRGSRARGKYDRAALYILVRYGVLCTQARDLFSAGSVAHRDSDERGGLYIQRALAAIEGEMLTAARDLPMSLIEEYWDEPVEPKDRIYSWLERADNYAAGRWKPSDDLFLVDR